MKLNTIYQGDCLDVMRTWPDECVDMCVTSPPYWGLRDYGVDGQIGLEDSPDAFVEKMVQVFREVRRVLKPAGTCWVNLGDSYAAGGLGAGSGKQRSNHGSCNGSHIEKPRKPPDGLKPKDLCGIPWRVAFALQQPYYTGRIRDEKDRIWLASMIDGEGCMFIHKRKAGMANGQGYTRKSDSYGAGLEVANTHTSIIERCKEITGIGSICRVERETRHKKRNIPLYRWNVRSNQCREIIREVYPYLVGKQHEARILLGCPSSGPDAEKAHASLIALHNGKPADIDFPAPKPMYEPGFYLRQDIIWSKKNPMPESVTDRCTKAHEYIFLLSKSPRYFYDAEAIREVGEGYGRSERFRGDKYTNNASYDNSRDWNGESQGGGKAQRDGTGRNKRSVWTVPTEPCPEAHFATYPRKLIEPCILAGCPEWVCPACGKGRERIVEKVKYTPPEAQDGERFVDPSRRDKSRKISGKEYNEQASSQTTGWTDCGCGEGFVPGVILDPFMGAGTTALVAYQNRRDYVGCELNPDYIAIAERRIAEAKEQYALFEERA